MKAISLTPIKFSDSMKDASQQLSGSMGVIGSLQDALSIARHARSLLDKQHYYAGHVEQYVAPQQQPIIPARQESSTAAPLPTLQPNTTTLDLQKVDKVQLPVSDLVDDKQSSNIVSTQPFDASKFAQPTNTVLIEKSQTNDTSSDSQVYTIINPDGELLDKITDLSQLSQYVVSNIKGSTIVAEKVDIDYYRDYLYKGLEFVHEYSKNVVPSYLPFVVNKMIDSSQQEVNSRISAYVSSLVSAEISRLLSTMGRSNILYSAPASVTTQLHSSATRFSYNQQVEGEHLLLQKPLSDYKISYVELTLPTLRENAKVHHLAQLVIQKLLENLTSYELADLLSDNLLHVVTSLRVRHLQDRKGTSFDVCVFILRSHSQETITN